MIDPQTLPDVITSVVTSAGISLLAVRSWVRRMEKRAEQVEAHEGRIAALEAALRALVDLKDGQARMASDIAYIRGWMDGKQETEKQ